MKKLSKIVSILLCLIMAFTVCACDYPSSSSQGTGNPPGQIQTPGEGGSEGDGGDGGNNVGSLTSTISYNYEDYIGDLETFVYGLLITKLEYVYDVFPAYVQLSSGYFVYGLGYTDYTECYTNEDESVAYFMSGFIPFVGELDVPQEDFDTGLYLYNIDYQDEETFFVWKYKSEAFLEHCVVYGAYLQYGVDENGQITYNAIPFEREKCDTSLGSLYSYDDSRYLYDVDFGEYMPIAGISLAETFDYAEFEKEVNAFIEEQNANWMTYDVETVAYTSQDAVVGYLLSLQEETFLGYPVEQLIELSQQLDPLECFRITPDGLTVIDIQEIPPEQPSALCKWLVGSACAITVALDLVASYVALGLPSPWKEMLSTFAGARMGACIEIFMQVVVENKTLGDVQWSKVGIATVSGAVSGFLNPYLMGMGGAKGFIVDTAVDALIGGVEQMTYALVDGAKGEQLLAKFGDGFLIGAVVSAGFKGIAAGVSAVIKKISKPAQQVADNLAPKLTKTASNIAESTADKVDNSVGKVFKTLKKADMPEVFMTNNKVDKTMAKCIEDAAKFAKGTDGVTDSVAEFAKKQFKKSLNGLKVDGWLSLDGKSISKKQIKALCENASDGDILAKQVYKLKDGTETIVLVRKINYSVDVMLPGKSYDIGALFTGKSARTKNFIKAAGKMIDEGFDGVPQEITDKLLEKHPGRKLSEILKEPREKLCREIVSIVESSRYVFHESTDLRTITLVLRELHDKVRGYQGVSHVGGIGFLETIKSVFGITNFAEYVNAARNGIRINFAT